MERAGLECGHTMPMLRYESHRPQVTMLRCDKCNGARRKIQWIKKSQEEI